jgi:hypothetical protein
MFREQHNFDAWLTNQPVSDPLFHSYENADRAAYNKSYDDNYISAFTLAFDNFDELRCVTCSKPVGYILYDDNIPATSSFTEFWQCDEDGEHLLCVSCYEEITKEIE